MMLQHLLRGAIEATKFRQEFFVRQGMGMSLPTTNVRRTGTRDDHSNRMYIMLSAELAGEFKTEQRTKAVAKKGEWLVQEWKQGVDQSLDEIRQMRERTFRQPSPSSG